MRRGARIAGAALALATFLGACAQEARGPNAHLRVGAPARALPPPELATTGRLLTWEALGSSREGARGIDMRLDGVDVHIAGFVVPLDFSKGDVREFLLVPYYGACIHVPPPPPNQVIHVTVAQPAKLKAMSVVWVAGRLGATAFDGPAGKSGYRMALARVVPVPSATRPAPS